MLFMAMMAAAACARVHVRGIQVACSQRLDAARERGLREAMAEASATAQICFSVRPGAPAR